MMRGLRRKPNHTLNPPGANGHKAKVKQNRAVLRSVRSGVNPRLRSRMTEGRADRKMVNKRPGREGGPWLAIPVGALSSGEGKGGKIERTPIVKWSSAGGVFFKTPPPEGGGLKNLPPKMQSKTPPPPGFGGGGKFF